LLQNSPILNYLGQNFHAVVEIEEEDSGASMLPPSAILEICCFLAFSNMEYSLQARNS